MSVGGAWERQRESRPLSQLTLDSQIATHRVSQIAAYRQSETGALLRGCETPAELDERLEDRRELLGGDADAGIADGHADGGRVAEDVDRAAGGL